MPVYNAEAYLEEAIESVLAQTFCDYEFLVIDDGSTDGSGALLRHYAESDRRLRLFRQENRGVVASLNRGWRLAGACYIARMDADDVALPDRLERQVSFLDRNAAVAVVGGGIILIDRNGTVLEEVPYPSEPEAVRASLLEMNPVAHPAAMIRKEALEAVDGYRKLFRHAEDYDLWLRLADRYEIANVPEAVLYYRIHSEKVTLDGLAEQITSTLAARAAARERRLSGDDPTSGLDRLTFDALVALGVTLDAVEQEVVDAHLSWARLAVRGGDHEMADRLIARLGKSAEGSPLRPSLRRELDGLRATMARREGRRLRAQMLAARALLTDPRGLARQLRAQLHFARAFHRHAR